MTQKEVTIARSGELQDGEMKQVSVDGTEILLARVRGRYHAVGAHCTHYGAPLVEGALCDERIVCPWHHACFNAATGDLEEPPALDALPHYELKVENENVIVSLTDETADRRTPTMAKRNSSADARLFVILGGGAAGDIAAQTLREDGFQGRILMITREDRTPYDRPDLSKDYLQGHAEPEWMPLRADEFYAEHGIELWRGKEVVRVDAAKKTIDFKDGDILTYDSLLVATGGTPRRLVVPGSHLKNICVLRSFGDADAMIEAAKQAPRVVVIGASFIGMETAASLRERKLAVTVVAPGEAPFEKTLGAEVGQLFQRIHEAHGVQFKLGASVTRFEGDSAVQWVVLDSGERVEADLVVVGVGVRPATAFLEGVELHADGGVVVDEYLRASDSVYAAGDIAYFPSALTNERQRIEHWRTAQQQGRVAAHNMAGQEIEFDGVPFFWTRQFDAGLLYVGHAASWDEIIYQGEVPAQDFLAFYVKDNCVRAVAGMNRDRDMAALEELMRLRRMPAPAQLRNGPTDFLELLGNDSARDEFSRSTPAHHLRADSVRTCA
jgi:NADPH-dependent 2,4-dienoyl-CoA reductase/sulfur reductase-like enzyme/nitrite reductase/ring-hydroxylating ferredoxin subunit